MLAAIFPLRIFSVNVTNPQETADLVKFTEVVRNEKLFFCSVNLNISVSLKIVICAFLLSF